MGEFVINGGKRLCGQIKASGSKNSAVAVIIASLVTNGISEITGVPDITDVRACLELIECLGIKTEFSGDKILIDTNGVRFAELPNELIKRMRASSYLIGASLARFGYCDIPKAGGCDFGSRPVNYHIDAMVALGAVHEETELGERLTSKGRLRGNRIVLKYPSVGATVNSLLAAVSAYGVTVIENAAKEPHIVDTVTYLNSCGADISGAGSGTLKIIGKHSLHGGKIKLSSDMIESGTYLLYGLMTGGNITVEETEPEQLSALFDILSKMGARINIKGKSVSVISEKLSGVSVLTAPYPAFPTDLQPQLSALLGISKGISTVYESVFNERFGYVKRLLPFGFKGSINDRTLTINGIQSYSPASSYAPDLRGGAALVGAALSAEGKSSVGRTELIKRGYSNFTENLTSLGAEIFEITE